MGEGVLKAMALVDERKAAYKRNGVDYYRPWVFLLTDGEPQGEPSERFDEARQRVYAAEKAKQVAFFAVGVEGANMERLAQLTPRAPARLVGLDFAGMFVWLSKSAQAVSHSETSDQVALPPAGWASV
jgi:uncharacterized protein YegL